MLAKKEEPFPLKRHPKRKAAAKYQHISGGLVFVLFLRSVSTVTIIISIVTLLLIVIIIASHGLRAGSLRETVWHSHSLV